jgi:hypothetical protein
MAGFPAGVCGVPCSDAVGIACRRSPDLNVSVLQRRVSARFGCEAEATVIRQRSLFSGQPEQSGSGIADNAAVAHLDTGSGTRFRERGVFPLLIPADFMGT